MKKKMYLVMAISERQEAEIFGTTHMIPMSWADGMIGVSPVFSNKKKAKKYAGKRPIMVVEEATNENPND